MDDIKKRALIHGVDEKNGILGTTEREKQITSFIKQDKSTNPLEMLKAWLQFQSSLSEKDKRDTIVKYEMWLMNKNNTNIKANFAELPPMVDSFINNGDVSKNYYELLVNWEKITYNTFSDIKDKHIKEFLNKHKLK
ncbi:hypothetical protein [Weissella bombi]|uniref:hypothetical protein n=1 Tax=Weissella bombi TaxID=1505725 RepID=UPI003AF1FB57